jgi:hypothetical protein
MRKALVVDDVVSFARSLGQLSRRKRRLTSGLGSSSCEPA